MSDLANFILKLQEKGELYISVKVLPGAGKNAIIEFLEDETIKIALKAQAERGKANSELISFLAKEFKVNKDRIQIISGKTARIKLIKIK